jgi:hypothetical protein
MTEIQRLETDTTIPSLRRVFLSVVWDIWILSFEFVSDFGFEISDLVAGASLR